MYYLVVTILQFRVSKPVVKEGDALTIGNIQSAKKLRNSGEEYFTKHAKFVEAKVFRGLSGLCCKHQCYEKLSEACFGLFKQFWSTGSYDIQTAFIAGSISQHQISKHSMKTVQAINGFKF